jgi:hypothetical protein
MTRRRLLRNGAVGALGVYAVGGGIAQRAAGAVAVQADGADAVTDWNVIASNAIVATAQQPPPVSALSFAMVHGAVYDAVNAIDGGYRPYLVRPATNPSDSEAAAAATAALRVLIGLFPGQQTALVQLYNDYMTAVPDDPAGAKAGGAAAGEAAAAAMLTARAHDGRGGAPGTFVGTTPGAWRPTPPLFQQDPAPWVANVLPFLVSNVETLRSDGPNPLTSAAYARDLNEVKKLGSLTSTRRTADQTDAAIFWQDHLLALSNRLYRTLAASQRLSIADNARLFAMVNLAAADAYIGCWNDKYAWTFWRPITAIREADTDGNPATEADPSWTPLFDPSTPAAPPPLVTPPFPDHPSGHCTAVSAIVHTLQNFFATDKLAFGVMSNKSHTTRTFDRFSDANKEVIDARVWAGIHFRTADQQGAVLGKKVAHWLNKHYFQPIHCHRGEGPSSAPPPGA